MSSVFSKLFVTFMLCVDFYAEPLSVTQINQNDENKMYGDDVHEA